MTRRSEAEPSERNDFHARQVEAMAGYGLPAKDIAVVLDTEVWILERDYRKELKAGAIKANAKVAESLFRRATGEGREAVVAAIFWMKTRAGWRGTTVHEVSPHAHRTPEEIEARIRELLSRAEARDPDRTARLTNAVSASPQDESSGER
jgi:hypothetical protein